MATKQYFATGDFRYGTRMMRAGDPVEMTAPHARLYTALGKISDKRPRAAKPAAAEPVETATVEEPATKAPAKRKATRRKKTA